MVVHFFPFTLYTLLVVDVMYVVCAMQAVFSLEAGEAVFLPGGWAHDIQSEGGYVFRTQMPK